MKKCEVCGKGWAMPISGMCLACEYEKHLAHLQEDILYNECDETHDEDVIVCPWCGGVLRMDGDYDVLYTEGEREIECSICGRQLIAYTCVRYSYSTERKEADHVD